MCVCVFAFGFWDRMWDLIVLVANNCLSVYFVCAGADFVFF